VLEDELNQFLIFARRGVENLSFAIHDVLLQIQGDLFVDAEILHFLGNGDAHFFAQAEKMVDAVSGIENNGGMVENGNLLLSEILCGETFHLDERTEIYFQTIFVSQIKVGRLFSRRFWL
jgi:hypothetical protein